jgi:2-polyprenyl-3-methyl-5-hydroxy-6-metoxy-1,4-benzoquinol methylase
MGEWENGRMIPSFYHSILLSFKKNNTMQYDPIKRSLGNVFNKSPFLRKIFYRLLDLLLLRAWHIKRELNIWKKTTSNDVQILDAGAGFGQYTYHLSTINKKWNVLGVDVKQEQIDDCNNFFKQIGENNRITFEYADLTQYKKENYYDLILTVDVMEHIEEDVKVFENFYASLKKGGTLLISTPSDKGGSDVHDEHEHSFIDEHVRDGYNIDDIRTKLSNAGFSVIEPKYSYGNPGKISWKLSMKYPITMLNVTKLFFIILPFYYLITFPFCLMLNFFDVRCTHKEGTGLIVKAVK